MVSLEKIVLEGEIIPASLVEGDEQPPSEEDIAWNFHEVHDAHDFWCASAVLSCASKPSSL